MMFNIKLYVRKRVGNSEEYNFEIPCKVFAFSGGEIQVRIDAETFIKTITLNDDVVIKAFIRSANDIMAVILMRDAVQELLDNHNIDTNIHLVCPYMPYARQDRVCHPGEAFSLRTMVRLLVGFSTVEVWDVHSEATVKLLRNIGIDVTNVLAADFVRPLIRDDEFVVAPDHGAGMRAYLCVEEPERFLQMRKERDPDTGFLSKFSLETPVADIDRNRGAIIIDDICDGGRTFVGAAKELRKTISGPLRLYVTHGTFSAGFDDLLQAFDEIIVANYMRDDTPPERVKVLF